VKFQIYVRDGNLNIFQFYFGGYMGASWELSIGLLTKVSHRFVCNFDQTSAFMGGSSW
jgi:hypothetical protein